MKPYFLLLSMVLVVFSTFAQQRNVNQDESKVPVFNLPEVLVSSAGEKITTSGQWEKSRRPELLSLFSKLIYGEPLTTTSKIDVKYETIRENPNALNGKAICKQVKISLSNHNLVSEIYLLIYLPKALKTNIPVFLSYNFNGNHTVQPDPEILISPSLAKISSKDQNLERGDQSSRWSVERITDE